MRTLASRRVALALVLMAVGAMSFLAGSAGAQSTCEENGCVRAIEVSGLIDPVIVRFVDESLTDAEATPGVVAVVLELDSPGVVVSDEEFQQFVERIVDSPIPVSAWVGTGSEARGGAVELLAVLDQSSMAPGSALGDVGEQRLDPKRFGDVLGEAASRVVDGEVSAGTARDLGLIDRVAPTIGDHVVEIDGVKTKTVDDDGEPRRSLLTQVVISKLPLGDQLFHTAASPSVAYLALAIGIGLLIFEFFTAGVGVAGLVGAFAVVMAGYGLGVLPHRGWALGLLIASGIAFMIDVQAGVPRIWTTTGLVGWVVGSVFLFEEVPRPWVALSVGIIGMAVAMLSGMPAMVRSRFGTPTIGRTWMIGEMGEAATGVAPDGTVLIRGALWRARTNRATPIDEGAAIRVVAIDGLTLEVEPEEGGAIDYREMRGRRTARTGGGAADGSPEMGDADDTTPPG